MTAEEIKALVRRIPEEALNKGDLTVFDEVCSPDFVTHFPGQPDQGVEAVKAMVKEGRTAFPDMRYTIDDEILEGDKLVQLATVHGTNTGTFMGLPPTGKSATWKEVHIVRVANGKIVEHTGIVDEAGMMRQLGLIPAMAQTRP
jgi:predicted ester cyclase